MSDKKVRVPQIRFAGFMGDWEERKLANICSMHARIGWQNLRTSEFLNTGDYYLVTGTDFDNGRINFDTCHYVEKERYDQDPKIQIDNGSILITKDGTLGKVALVEGLDKPATLNAGVFNVTIKTGNIDGKYIYQYLKAPFLMDYVSKHATGGTIKHLNQNILVDFPVLLPKKVEEQRKLGELYHNLDNLITLQQRQLDKLAIVKKTMLEKMFPKDGANVPEIRFAGFKGAWEQRKLSAMTDYKNGKGHEDRQSDNGKYELINLNSISIDGGLKHSGKFVDETEDTLVENDLVMVLSDVGHGDLLGRVALIPENDRFVLNQRVALLRPNNTVDPQFLFSHINAHQQYFKTQGAGMSQLNISKGSVEGFTSWVPHKEEQIKIGELFSNLDNLITLHQRELNALKTLKKSMLQQLFV